MSSRLYGSASDIASTPRRRRRSSLSQSLEMLDSGQATNTKGTATPFSPTEDTLLRTRIQSVNCLICNLKVLATTYILIIKKNLERLLAVNTAFKTQQFTLIVLSCLAKPKDENIIFQNLFSSFQSSKPLQNVFTLLLNHSQTFY